MRLALIVAALTLAPAAAYAGACPSCTSDADCIALTEVPVAKCVEWNRDFGCGSQRVSCCPGQGCSVDKAGNASCINEETCRPFSAPTPDAGDVRPDTGSPADSGAGAPPPQDAGDTTPAMDATTSTTGDNNGRAGGSTAPRLDRGGCGCNVAATDVSGEWGWLAGLAALSLLWIRSRSARM